MTMITWVLAILLTITILMLGLVIKQVFMLWRAINDQSDLLGRLTHIISLMSDVRKMENK